MQESAAKEERSRRELAEQLQSEADTERTKIQVGTYCRTVDMVIQWPFWKE